MRDILQKIAMMRKKAVIEICKFTGQGNWREFRRSNSYFITRRCISGISGVRILNRTTASLSKSPSNLSFHRSLSSDHNVFYSVIHAAETSFKTIHTFSGLPWWAVIISTTVIARSLVTLPLAIHQNRTIAIMELLLPTLKEYQEAVKHNVIVKCRRQNLPVDEANRRIRKAAKKVARDLYSQEGCNPYKVAVLPWVQLPLWITLSFSLRNMTGMYPGYSSSNEVVSSLASEGCLWFQDLTLPDAYFILPLFFVTSNLLNIELHALKKQASGRFRRMFTNYLRFITVGMLIVAIKMPVVMTLYWATSSVYGLTQNVLFKFPRVRRGLKIPRTPSESQTPFSDLWSTLQEKARSFLILQREASRRK